MNGMSTENGVRKLPAWKILLFSALVLSVFLALVTAAAELMLRNCCASKYSRNDPPPPYNTAQKDELLGWKMTPGYAFDGKMKDESGGEYDISIRYDSNGFKAFGDTGTSAPSILFIGDSYTASIEVSNERSFFNLLGDSLGAEVFAYGHAGYGTLQQYMVLDQWVDVIRPEVVLWEVCSNDFIDNYAPLEIACGYKVGERRPYLSADGEIYYERPLTAWQMAGERLFVLQWLEQSWRGLLKNLLGREAMVGEYFIATEGRAYATFDAAVGITEKIADKIKARLPAGTKLMVFSADTYQPQLGEFRRIFESRGFLFFDAPAMEVEKARTVEKQVVKSVDGYHWNERGHAIVAGALYPFIRQAMAH